MQHDGKCCPLDIACKTAQKTCTIGKLTIAIDFSISIFRKVFQLKFTNTE